MSAWNEARRISQQIRAAAQAERSPADGATPDALPLAKERFERRVCVYCGGNRKLRTGYLAISKYIFYCKDHKAQYLSDKPWEERHKRSLGL